MPACWNCGQDIATVFKFCNKCGKPLPRNEEQTRRMLACVDFLLDEVTGWSWLDAERRREVLDLYRERRQRLIEPIVAPQPVPVASTVTVPESLVISTRDVPVDLENASTLDELTSKTHQPAPAPAPEPDPVGAALGNAVSSVSAFMEERNIRWFHTVGGLLLLAGCIGFLRSHSSTYGRYFIMLVMLTAPIASFAGAYALRLTLPISSRLLSILGGLLLPAGLLGLYHFGVIPATVGPAWYAFSFGFSAAVLFVLAALLIEPACLYLGAICLALAPMQLAPLLGHFPLSGAVMLAGAFGLLGLERMGRLPDLSLDLRRAAHMLAALALVATVPSYNAHGNESQAMVVFFVGAVFFAMAGRMLEQPAALYAAAVVGSIGFAAEISYNHWSWIDLGYFWLVLGAMFQSLAWGREAEDPLATAALRIGLSITGVALLLLCGSDIAFALDRGFAEWPRAQAIGSLVLAVLTTLYYAVSARLYGRPVLVGASTAAAAYAWLLMAVVARCSYAMYPPFLAVFPLLVLGLALLVRPSLERRWLEPSVRVAVGLCFIPAALCLVAVIAPEASLCPLSLQSITLWIVTAFFVLLTRWTGDYTPSPAACTFAVAAWARGAMALTGTLAWGLWFMPLIAILAVLAQLLDRFADRRWALAPAVTAALVLMGVLAMQPVAWSFGSPETNAWILLSTTLITGLCAAPYSHWWSGQRLGLVLACMSALALPAAAVATGYARQWPLANVQAGLYALAIGYLMAGRLLHAFPDWKDALRAAGLATSALLWIIYQPSEHWQQPLAGALPAAIWLATALLEKSSGIGAGSVALLVVVGGACGGFPLDNADAIVLAERVGLMAAFTVGYAALARSFDGFLAVAWVCSGIGWFNGMRWSGANYSDVWLWLGWWPFQVLWAVPLISKDSPTLRSINQLTMAGLLLITCAARPPYAFFWTALAYATAIGCWAGHYGKRNEASGALVLATAGWLHLAVRENIAQDHFALYTSLVALLAGIAVRWLAQQANNWRAAFLKPMVAEAFGMAVVASVAALEYYTHSASHLGPAVLASFLAAVTMGLLTSQIGALGWHAGYVMLHLQLLVLLPAHSPLEWWTMPLAAWLLLWSTLSSGEEQGRFEMAAAAVALLPSIGASAFATSGVHAVAAGMAGLTLLLFGTARGRLLAQVSGTAGMLLEALVQLHLALVSQPWQVYATVAGVLLIALGLLFERRRQQILAFGARLMGQVV